MAAAPERHLTAIILGLGAVFIATFSNLVVLYGRQLRTEIRARMIERDAAVLNPVAQQQIERGASLVALLPDAQRKGILALAIFDEAGVTLRKIPDHLPLVELPLDDFVSLQDGRPITRFHPSFPLHELVPDVARDQTSPVLEIVLPLYRGDGAEAALLGFARYHLDARPLAAELAALDESVRRKTTTTLTLGILLIVVIVAAAWAGLRRAQRIIAERNARLTRTNQELTLAAKASVIGQITAHLMHGLQSSVAGLRAAVGEEESRNPDWKAATSYAERLQLLVQEAITLLVDTSAQATYQLTGAELTAIIRRHNAPLATTRGVEFEVGGEFEETIDSHRGGLLCLIVNNLAQNALAATPSGRRVVVRLAREVHGVSLTVTDEGPGIPSAVQENLFVPGHTTRPGGSGLGLAISQLLARQIGANLELLSTGPHGTTFRVALPLTNADDPRSR